MKRLCTAALATAHLVSYAYAESPEDVAKLLLAHRSCKALESAVAYAIKFSVVFADKHGSTSIIMETRDLRAARWLSVARSWKADDPSVWEANGSLVADGKSYECYTWSGSPVKSCQWKPGEPLPNPDAASITQRFINDEIILTPSRGGATLILEAVPAHIAGAAWTLSVTPPGGRPISYYLASSGQMVGFDVSYGENDSTEYNLVKEWKTFDGCTIPSAFETRSRLDGPAEMTTSVLEFDYLNGLADPTFSASEEPKIP